MFIEISNNLKRLSKYFSENLYIVGGYVRNKLLALPAGDVDVASSLTVEELQKLTSTEKFEDAFVKLVENVNE